MDYRIVAVFANVLLDQLGLPLPAVPTVIVAGALAAQGQMSTLGLFGGTLLACVIGDSAWFAAGRMYGSGVMKLLCRISLTPDSCVSETQARFERWGANALVAAKFVPGLAIIAPPLAGATRMGWPRFLLFSTLGSSAWVAATLLLGALFRDQIAQLLPRLASLGLVAVAMIAALLALYLLYKWWERARFYAMLRMARISVSELYELMGAGTPPLIVDVRSSTAVLLEPRRIPGAIHIPLHDLESHVRELPRDRDIVAYCTCPNEASAAQVAKLLIDNGFKRVRPLHGGLDAWIASGYTVEALVIASKQPQSDALPKSS